MNSPRRRRGVSHARQRIRYSSDVRGLVVPDRTEDFTADPVELFFDLAFVFAFSQLVGYLIEHPTGEGVAKASLVFALMWLGWSQLTWAANAVAGNSRTVRLIFLVATVASVPMAAAVTTAFEGSGPLFAVPLALITSMGLALMFEGARGDAAALRSVRAYSAVMGTAMALVVLGSVFAGWARIAIWIVTVAAFCVAGIQSGGGQWTMRAGHFAERHGLIIIVALGEVIVAIGKPLVDSLQEGGDVPTTSAIALTSAGVFAAALWWAYFDRVQPALEHRLDDTDGPKRAELARDAYTFSHLPIVAGVVCAAAALEEITLHPDDELDLAFRLMMIGGLALFLGGVGIAVFRAFGVVAKERISGVVAVAVVAGLGSGLDGLVLLIVIDVILLAVLLVEHWRIEVRPG